MNGLTQDFFHILKGDKSITSQWINNHSLSKIVFCLSFITIGCGLYGISLGYWRAPMMSVYIGVKLPLLIVFTLCLNGFLNGILGMLLGTGLSLRQSFLSQLISFALFSLILGALAPATFFFADQLAPPDSATATETHSIYLLGHTLLIAYAGVIANVQLFHLLIHICPTRKAAVTTLFSWLLGNAIAGSQLSWIMRPFFGSPHLEPAFLREDPLNGTFLESVWNALSRFLSTGEILALALFLAALTTFLLKQTITSTNHP